MSDLLHKLIVCFLWDDIEIPYTSIKFDNTKIESKLLCFKTEAKYCHWWDFLET